MMNKKEEKFNLIYAKQTVIFLSSQRPVFWVSISACVTECVCGVLLYVQK